MWQRIGLVFCAAVGMAPGVAAAAPVPFSVGGDNTAASIQATVDAFRAALGDPNNGNAPGPLFSGRREINWDGGGQNNTVTAPVTPFEVFLDTRGAQFTTPGTGLSQAPPSGLETLFPGTTYGTTFSTFSPLRLFVPVGSNVTDALFFLPGTDGAVPATVSGFGAVFTDVDLPDSTQIEYFDAGGHLLFSDFVEPGTVADGSLSFLGVFFNAGEGVAGVRITTGTTALGPNDAPGDNIDVVAMDDFLYGEPRRISEPSLLALFAIGAVALWRVQRRAVARLQAIRFQFERLACSS
jgi:hypothetical protein